MENDTMRFGFTTWAAMLSMASFSVAAQKPETSLHPYLDRSHLFLVGAYFQEVKAEIRETRGPLPPKAVNLRHLGVDKTDTSWHLEYRFRISESWGLLAAAQRFSGQGTRGNVRAFNFGSVQFPVGVELNSTLDVDTYIVDVVYTTYRSQRAELAIGAGIHAFDFATKIEGRKVAGQNESGNEIAFEELLAPLPNLRLQGFYAINSRWAMSGSVGWMSANVDEWSGDFLYLNGRLQYLFANSFGMALGYQFTDVDVSRRQKRRQSEYDIEFSGPSLHLSYGF
jgi:hypothetical protein